MRYLHSARRRISLGVASLATGQFWSVLKKDTITGHNVTLSAVPNAKRVLRLEHKMPLHQQPLSVNLTTNKLFRYFVGRPRDYLPPASQFPAVFGVDARPLVFVIELSMAEQPGKSSPVRPTRSFSITTRQLTMPTIISCGHQYFGAA